MNDWTSYGLHGGIVALLIYLIRHLRSISVTMKNGGRRDDE